MQSSKAFFEKCAEILPVSRGGAKSGREKPKRRSINIATESTLLVEGARSANRRAAHGDFVTSKWQFARECRETGQGPRSLAAGWDLAKK